MIGNDIIDLALATTESNWQRKGWLQKLFCVAEQEMIHNAEEQTLMVWLLWSMKESAYKIVHRQQKAMTYAPGKLACSLDYLSKHTAKGTVQFRNDTFYTKTVFSSAYIHTIALVQNNLPLRNVYIRNEYETQSSCCADHFFYKDHHGVPYLLDTHGNIKDVSKSHHGRFEAIVF